jgi:N-sulfoglucosamine sulfohydrolase
MKNFLLSLFLILMTFSGQAQKQKQPNILFIIADDISRNSNGVYGCKYIKTPAFDRIAKEGVLFTNAYSNNPKCAPARAMILTGRYSWQLKEACNHNPIMPEEWVFYPDILADNGYTTGFTGKGWAPGVYKGNHNPAGPEFSDLKLVAPYKYISNTDYVGNFELFLKQRKADKPFCFWIGTHEAHRPFERDVYLKAGINPKKVNVQASFPDNDIVRNDLADYGAEVEYHDKQIQKCLDLLKEKGLLDNTIIIATSDHGMAFPHIKGQLYNEAFQIPFAVRWGEKIKSGRVVDDYINFPDVAPTLLDIAGIKPHKQMTGKSFLNLLLSDKSGKLTKERDHALLGKERHDLGRTDGEQLSVGYPIRGIRNDKFLYLKNFKPNRWPTGDPEYNYMNCDDSPTKTYLTTLKPTSPDYLYYLLSFGKRVEEELYDLVKDPDCVHNLAQIASYAKIKTDLNKQMTKELTLQKDPRILGNGDIFDYFPHCNPEKQKEVYGAKYLDMQEQFNKKYNPKK